MYSCVVGHRQALTVLDYLVAHGSERVIEEIREHAYQISVISSSLCVLAFMDHFRLFAYIFNHSFV